MRTEALKLDALAVRAQINELFTDMTGEQVRDWLDLTREIHRLLVDATLAAECAHDGGVDWQTALGEKRCGLCQRRME